MSKPPLPDAAVAMLRKPNPAVITTLRRDGQPFEANRRLVKIAFQPGRVRGDANTLYFAEFKLLSQ